MADFGIVNSQATLIYLAAIAQVKRWTTSRLFLLNLRPIDSVLGLI